MKAFPDNDIDAKLSVEFKRERSFLLKASLSVMEIQNLNKVAKGLKDKPQWEKRFRVVSAIYTGEGCSIISSKAADSRIELSGKANALKQFDLGSASAEIQASVKKEIGLDIVGRKGVIGLGMFKLGFFDGVKTLGPHAGTCRDDERLAKRPAGRCVRNQLLHDSMADVSGH